MTLIQLSKIKQLLGPANLTPSEKAVALSSILMTSILPFGIEDFTELSPELKEKIIQLRAKIEKYVTENYGTTPPDTFVKQTIVYKEEAIGLFQNIRQYELAFQSTTHGKDTLLYDKVCAGCCSTLGCTKKCSRCKKVYYCNEACQKKHWKEAHKRDCKGE